MSRTLLLPLVLMLGTGATFAAAAQRYDDGGRYAGQGDSSGPYYDYAQVVRVDPVIVSDGDPRGRCYERAGGDYIDGADGYRDDAYDRRDEDRMRDDRGSQGGRQLATVIGGVAGALLGSQVGGGDGRYLGTAVGTLVGSVAGRAIYQANDPGYRRSNVRVCEPLADGQERERVDGYDITYEYAGRRYQTHRDYNPGERIRVRVEVNAD